MINNLFYKSLAMMIEKETGILYLESDYDRLVYRVKKLKELLKVDTDEELLSVLQNTNSSNIQSLLISTATNNETSFFRDKKPFEVFCNNIIPEVLKFKKKRILKIWSVASSTGQEPYSLAMKIKETPDLFDCIIDIQGSDIDEEVLLKCKAGIYNQEEVQRGLPTQFLSKYFDQVSLTSWSVKNSVKDLITFFRFNLLTEIYPDKEYDIIFCRNVLIYQSIENKTKVINNLYNALASKGFLVLGGAENLIGIKSNFKAVTLDDFVVYFKE